MPERRRFGPVLDLQDLPEAQIYAAMLFPKDSRRREEFIEIARLQVREMPLVEGEEPSALYRALDPAKSHYIHTGKPFTNGALVGGVLFAVRQIAEHHLQHEVSVSKGIRIVTRDILNHRLKTLGGKMIAADERTVWDIWKHYQPSAHLWAAWQTLWRHIRSTAASETDFLTCQAGAPLQDLPLFLAVAEDWRRFGESLTTRANDERTGAKRSILPRAETWKVPAGWPLPVLTVRVPPLAPHALTNLEEYKVEKNTVPARG